VAAYDIPFISSMKTCANILTVSWPTMPVAKATRHGQFNEGYVSNKVLSAIGHALGGNLDGLIVSR